MSVEGRLTIDLDRAADGTGRVQIASSRPLGLARAFAGKTADDAVRTLPLLFNVCGMAQGVAAVQACECALAVTVDRQTGALRALLVCMESLREHLVRAVMDWRRFLGHEPQTTDMLRVMRLCVSARHTLDPDDRLLTIGGVGRLAAGAFAPILAEVVALTEELVTGEPMATWLARVSADDLDAWSQAAQTPSQQLVRAVLDRGWAGAGKAEVCFLPDLSDGALAERLFEADTDAFVAAPTWDGSPCETSPLGRQAENPLVRDLARVHGSGLSTRIAARLVEIGELPRVMGRLAASAAEDGAGQSGDGAERGRVGRGVAQVEAARGRLVHGVEIADNVVQRYAVVAPTEWNFHGAGGAARGLADIAGRSEDVSEIADLFVTTVDPCVGYELRVH